jgi:hypothetical protein
MFGSPIMEDFKMTSTGNCNKYTTPEPTQEYPSYNDDLYLDASEMAMLELLVLCDSSGAHCGFYDDLLMLLRQHVRIGICCFQGKGMRFIS